MTEVSRRYSFGDTALHQPEFLDIHEVLQAASQPSVEQFQKALQHLETANYDRFVKLRDVAREQSSGCGESDLRRLKRQFASLKNTFVLYDVKQSFFEGLADGCPDGTEESQLQEVEEEVKKHSAEVKQYKERNLQMQGEMLDLIESIAAMHKQFSQQRAEIGSHLECISAEAAQQESSQMAAVPELPEGPDEAACKTLLAHEASCRRSLEAALASNEAQSIELLGAIQSEEAELQALHSQVRELETDKLEDRTQEISARFAEGAAWCEEMSALRSTIGGICLLEAVANCLHLQLKTLLAISSEIAPKVFTHTLILHLEGTSCRLLAAELAPADAQIADIVQAATSRQLHPSFAVREIHARLKAHLRRVVELEEARVTFKLAAVEGEKYEAELAGGVRVCLTVPAVWPEEPQFPQITGLQTPSGLSMSPDVVKQVQNSTQETGEGIVSLLEDTSKKMQVAFGQ